MSKARASIIARLDAALERVAIEQMTVRAIYLTPADLAELGRAARGEVTSHRGHAIRVGNSSTIYSAHGVGVVVRKRLSHRVAAP